MTVFEAIGCCWAPTIDCVASPAPNASAIAAPRSRVRFMAWSRWVGGEGRAAGEGFDARSVTRPDRPCRPSPAPLDRLRGAPICGQEGAIMARFLILLGLVILAVGLLWPFLSRLGLGRLPGDIVIQRDNFTYYFPLMTCILVSVLLSVVFWLFNR